MKLIALSLCLVLAACGGGSTPAPDIQNPPIPVSSSSYENEMMAAHILGPQEYPHDWKPCGDRFQCGSFPTPAMVFADFMRDGSYSMITHTIQYNAVNPLDFSRKGHIKFYRFINGVWTDRTSEILRPEQTQGCLHASKALVADFMQNGRPSVFFSCYGFDGPGGSGEKQRILLAQNDGTYKNVELSSIDICACHSASAADVNGDSYPDIVVVDNYLRYAVFFLINNKDGTFTPDYNRLPSDIINKALFEVELIDFNNDGKYDIQLGGVEQCCVTLQTPSRIYYNNNNKVFDNGVSIPSIPGYGMITDVVYDNGFVYMLKTNDAPDDFWTKYIIQRVNLFTMESVVLFESVRNSPVPSLIVLHQNKIVALNSYYNLSIPK